MPTYTSGKQKLYYEVHGSGPCVFLIHDILEDHTHWKVAQEALSEHYQVVTADLRGSGQSSVPAQSYKIEDLAQDIVELASHLKVEKFHVIGDSLGGAVAQYLAYKHADHIEKVVLCNSFLKISNSTTWFLEMLDDLFKAKLSYSEVYKHALPWFYSSWFLEFEDSVDKLLKAVRGCKHPLKAKGYHLLLEALKHFDSTKWASRIKHQTLFIVGEEDLFCLFKESRALISKIKDHQVELCSGGHKSKAESPTRMIEVVLKFLKEEDQENNSSTKA